MKKTIKILLIVIAAGVLVYVGRIIYGFWVWRNVSADDQLKIVQATYDGCLAKGKSKEECQDTLIWGVDKVLKTQAEEFMATILDKTASAESRWIALQVFHALSRGEGELLSKNEAELYFAVANDKENPEDLRQAAAKYLLGTVSQDEDVQKLQVQILASPTASVEYKREAIKSVAGSDDANAAIDALLKALEDPSPEISVKAGKALIGQWPEIKNRVPDLLDIAFDETKPLWARNGAITAIGDLAIYYGYKDAEAIEKLQDLLDYSHYGIRSSAADALKHLTGQEYEIKEGTEAEVLEMFGLE